jgi:hypothetical protein
LRIPTNLTQVWTILDTIRFAGEGAMAASFFEQPVLNSPYEAPRFHHALDAHGQPLDVPPVEGRRRSEIITSVPMPRMQTGRTPSGVARAWRPGRSVRRGAEVTRPRSSTKFALTSRAGAPSKPGRLGGHADDGAAFGELALAPIRRDQALHLSDRSAWR